MRIKTTSTWKEMTDPIKDTGWRNITSSVVQGNLGGATATCKIRRLGDEVTLVFDITKAGTSMGATRSIIAGSTSTTHPLRAIGLPIGAVVSQTRVRQDAVNKEDAIVRSDWITVSGKGAGSPPEREAEMFWKATSSSSTAAVLSLDRYIVTWVTPDPFPTTFPGTATTL